MEQHYPFTLPPLPYAYDALAPELIEKVLYFHHDKHFAAYVDALNQLLERAPASTTTCISAPSTPCRSPPRTRRWRALLSGTSAAWRD